MGAFGLLQRPSGKRGVVGGCAKGNEGPVRPDTQGGVVGKDSGRAGKVAALVSDDQYISIEGQADWIVAARGKGRPGDGHQGATLIDREYRDTVTAGIHCK